MKINMVVGGRFNAPPMAAALARKTDLKIYSSVPSSYWPGAENCVTVIPHLSIIYAKLSRRSPSRKFKDFSTQFFSSLAARFMRGDADVIYAWATFGLEAMKAGQSRGAITLLDRACPHILFQENLLAEEADMLGVPFNKSAPDFLERCIEEYAIADTIVVPSNYTKRSFINLGFPESSLRLISLGPNFEPKQSFMANLPSQTDTFVVGVVAGSLLRKGLRYLIEAWIELKLPNSKLRLKCSVGELKSAPQLWQAIEATPNIEIVGYMKNLEDFYRSCDLFCLPSVDDGFGMVVFEAIACGCPVLVTENVGASDMVVSGKTGYIVEARNANALADKIQLLFNNRDKLNEMAYHCIEYYENYKKSDQSFVIQVNPLISMLQKEVEVR